MTRSTSKNRLAVLLLSEGTPQTYRAVQSVLKWGLPVHVGLTAGSLSFGSDARIRTHRVKWNDHQSEALNDLQQFVKSEFVLRIDSDEELLCFPELNLAELGYDIFACWYQESLDSSPKAHCRLYRNDPAICWTGRFHEYLTITGRPVFGDWMFLPSLVVRHYGYEGEASVSHKMARNMKWAQTGLDAREPEYSDLLTVARTESYQGRCDPLKWLQCFKHPATRYLGPQIDLRCEPAEMLCSCGYVRPALELLEADPLLLRLQVAVLADGLRRTGRLEPKRLDFLCNCLQNGFHSPLYSIALDLPGAPRLSVIQHIRSLADKWTNPSGGTLPNKGQSIGARPSRPLSPESSSGAQGSFATPLPPANRARGDVAVCILSRGNEGKTAMTVKSAAHFGLSVYIGSTEGSSTVGETLEGTYLYPLPATSSRWQARNQLLEYVGSEFVLWLESGETLFCFPSFDFNQVKEDVLGVQIKEHPDLTSTLVARMHRCAPHVRWAEEHNGEPTLMVSGELPVYRPWFSIIIRQDYDQESNDDRCEQLSKHEFPDGQIPACEPPLGDSVARGVPEDPSAQLHPLTWVRRFKGQSIPCKGFIPDSRIVAAEMLCSFGYTRPAEKVVSADPTNLRLQLAIMAAEFREQGIVDPERLTFTQDAVRNCFNSPFTSLSLHLLSRESSDCASHITGLAERWQTRRRFTTIAEEDQMQNNLQGRFQRIDAFDLEEFEDDLLVMNNLTREVVVLNAAGAALWDAFEWPVSTDDLVDMLVEAAPRENREKLVVEVSQVVQTLLSSRLIKKV